MLFEWFLVNFAMLFNQKPILFLVGLFLLFKQPHFALRLISLFFFTCTYNSWLKSLWQFPLPPGNDALTYAFPSGDYHIYIVVWGLIALETRKPWNIGCCGMLALLYAWGIVEVYHYHYWIDVLAALGFGLITVVLYRLGERRFNYDTYFLPVSWGLMFLNILMLINFQANYNFKAACLNTMLLAVLNLIWTFWTYGLNGKTKLFTSRG